MRRELTDHEKKLYRGSSAVYAWIIPQVQKVALEFGYAVAVHGSLVRDLDLLAVPWTDKAKSANKLVEAIHLRVTGGVLQPAIKQPHGRTSWAIVLDRSHFYVDLSVMARVPKRKRKKKAS